MTVGWWPRGHLTGRLGGGAGVARFPDNLRAAGGGVKVGGGKVVTARPDGAVRVWPS